MHHPACSPASLFSLSFPIDSKFHEGWECIYLVLDFICSACDKVGSGEGLGEREYKNEHYLTEDSSRELELEIWDTISIKNVDTKIEANEFVYSEKTGWLESNPWGTMAFYVAT